VAGLRGIDDCRYFWCFRTPASYIHIDPAASKTIWC